MTRTTLGRNAETTRYGINTDRSHLFGVTFVTFTPEYVPTNSLYPAKLIHPHLIE
jgi:hypothetical protein